MELYYFFILLNIFASFVTINDAFQLQPSLRGIVLSRNCNNFVRKEKLKLFSRCSAFSMGDSDGFQEINPIRKDLDEKKTPPYFQHVPIVDHHGLKLDIYSRLLQDRIILVGNEIDDVVANSVVAQLLHLYHTDPNKELSMYINCAGGSISSTMAIFDVMQFISCPINTVCFGTASAMGAFLLGAGTNGKRKALPNSRIMIHQPLGGARGQAADIEIQAREILFVRSQIVSYFAEFTGQSTEKIEKDFDRDFYMTAQQACNYGLIDSVVKTKLGNIPIPNI